MFLYKVGMHILYYIYKIIGIITEHRGIHYTQFIKCR